MLIKKDEEPFFYKFLSIAKEIIKKNPKYTPVFYGDDERLYLACGNHAAVYDFQSNLLLDDELREFGKIHYELSELPNGDLMLTKADHFNCQESYLIAVKNFFKKAGYMSKKIMQVAKEDSFRVPRIVETTGRWISEDDNKILAKIGYPNIYTLENIRVNEFRALAEGWNPRYLAAHDDVELNGGQTTISMTVYFNIKEDPRENAHDQQSMDFDAVDTVDRDSEKFESLETTESYGEIENVENIEDIEDYQEEEQLDALLEDAVVPEELEDDFDPMLA